MTGALRLVSSLLGNLATFIASTKHTGMSHVPAVPMVGSSTPGSSLSALRLLQFFLDSNIIKKKEKKKKKTKQTLSLSLSSSFLILRKLKNHSMRCVVIIYITQE